MNCSSMDGSSSVSEASESYPTPTGRLGTIPLFLMRIDCKAGFLDGISFIRLGICWLVSGSGSCSSSGSAAVSAGRFFVDFFFFGFSSLSGCGFRAILSVILRGAWGVSAGGAGAGAGAGAGTGAGIGAGSSGGSGLLENLIFKGGIVAI